MNLTIPCTAFQKNDDGSWTSIKSVDLGNIKIGPNMTFRKGVLFNGIDLATELDKQCLK